MATFFPFYLFPVAVAKGLHVSLYSLAFSPLWQVLDSPMCLHSSLSSGCDKTPGESNEKKEGFIVALGLKRPSPLWQRRHGGRSRRQLATLYPGLGSRKRILVLRSLSPFSSVQDPSLGDSAAHIQGRSSHFNEPNLETPSKMGPGICLLDDATS